MDASLKLSDENDIFMESLRMEDWILLLWSYIPDWASQVVQVIKNPPASAGDIRIMGSIPGSGRSCGGEHGNSLQCSCLENPMDRGAWKSVVHKVTKSQR